MEKRNPIATQMLTNADEIERLRRVFSSAVDRSVWRAAVDEFHARYNDLAFPGGLDSALDRILAGDPDAIECGICFLECRPYFFRSGYFHKTLIKRIARVPMSDDQQSRYDEIALRYKHYRQLRDRRSLRLPGSEER